MKFNFDTTFTKGKHTFKIVNNEIVTKKVEWLNLSASNANALIEHWLDKVIVPQVEKTTPNSDFDILVKEVVYLEAALNKVNTIKGLNCSYNNKDREHLSYRVNSLGSKFYDKIKWSSLSTPQELILKKLSNRSTDVATHDIQEFYNPVTDDTSKLTSWHKELMSFNYKKYGVNRNSIIKEKSGSHSSYYYPTALQAYNTVLMRIEHFKTILKQAGDDLINWSDQEISLRFTKLGLPNVNAWEISDYVSQYNEHLKKKGIKKVDKKKATSKGKLEDIIKNGGATLDEYWRYYKQASDFDSFGVIEKLDLEHLFKIIDSELKCVTKKLTDRYGQSNHFKQVAQFLCEKSVTKKDYKKIITWATPSKVTEAFMIKHKDHASLNEVTEYCQAAHISTSILINDEFYHTCLTKIADRNRYTLNSGLTWQYMVRMNEAEKIKILQKITTDDRINLNYDTLYGLYHNVNYNIIKNIIINNKDLLHNLSLKLVKENDHEAMVKCASKVGDTLEHSQKVSIFSKLTYAEKKKVIKANYSARGSLSFTGAIKDLTDNERLDLLKSIVNDGFASNYVTAIFKRLNKNRIILTQANKIVKDMHHVAALPLINGTVIECLTVDTKVELLNKDISLKDSTCYYSYYNTVPKTSNALGYIFFNNFKREDIDKVCSNLIHYEYRKFLAHTMSRDELEKCTKNEIARWHKDTPHKDLQESFFRHNLELFSYSFIKKFKDKASFKLVVGDRRDSSNKSFGLKLLEKMKVSNSIDYMFAD